MNIKNEYEKKKQNDKIKRVMHSPVCMWTGILMCPVLLILGGIVNRSIKTIDCIRQRKKKHKRKIHPKKKEK
jgi:hypothetical protein